VTSKLLTPQSRVNSYGTEDKSMKAYVAPIPPTLSRGIHRVAQALATYAPPGVEIVTGRVTPDAIVIEGGVDLFLCHVIGPEGWEPYLDYFRQVKARYAVFQYCLETTTWPGVDRWTDFWQGAEVVASYYPLQDYWEAYSGSLMLVTPKFLHTPLGVDTTVFYPRPSVDKEYIVGTSGYVDGMEVISDWGKVIAGTGGRQFHLGPQTLRIPHVPVCYRLGISDAELAFYWSQCRYVSGLRRTEGFELPALEGLACGARPVMFDREDARQWFGDHAEYIDEGGDIPRQLDQLLRRPYRPVTAEEIAWVKETFSWQTMAEKFWARVWGREQVTGQGQAQRLAPPTSAPTENASTESASPMPSSGAPPPSKPSRPRTRTKSHPKSPAP
jgi:glycosyltransferase involved in cell wall biosynthesis